MKRFLLFSGVVALVLVFASLWAFLPVNLYPRSGAQSGALVSDYAAIGKINEAHGGENHFVEPPEGFSVESGLKLGKGEYFGKNLVDGWRVWGILIVIALSLRWLAVGGLKNITPKKHDHG